MERLAGILFRHRRVPFFERAILDARQSVVSRYHDATALRTKMKMRPTGGCRSTLDMRSSMAELAKMHSRSEPRRIRCKEHLRFVASQPCVICGRTPSHAHHVRYAQARGLGLKVSDEFTVPLCAIHHQQLHKTTKEREWWHERKIDPLIVARALWNESQKRFPEAPHVASSGEFRPTRSQPLVTLRTQQIRHKPHRDYAAKLPSPAQNRFFHALAPAFIANVLTVAFVYCLAIVTQQEQPRSL